MIFCGCKDNLITKYFASYSLHLSDATSDIWYYKIEVHQNHAERWKMTGVDTGVDTMTGGRPMRVREYLDGKRFYLTYDDGASDTNIRELTKLHASHRRRATSRQSNPPLGLALWSSTVTSSVSLPKNPTQRRRPVDQRWPLILKTSDGQRFSK